MIFSDEARAGETPAFSFFGEVCMNAEVKSILPGSPASKTIIKPGDRLHRINGVIIKDVLDYRYGIYDERLLLELTGDGGKTKLINIEKPVGADIGLEFDSFLMDNQRSCANKCIFCFIDQLPEGMRSTLYYKDDDVRLSFLQGNYVTLTNMSKDDIARIIKLRISPVNVSIHSLDPGVRSYMMGSKRAVAGIDALKKLAKAGITLNCQIVCCPGVNDGAELSRTLMGLYQLGESINSVSIVPVGLTKHRQGLVALTPFDNELAIKTLGQVEAFNRICLKERGRRIFFCADELYIMSGRKLPRPSYYEGYPQLENGVGMMSLFISEFMRELRKCGMRSSELRKCVMRNLECGIKDVDSGAGDGVGSSEVDVDGNFFSVATGAMAGGYIKKLLMTAAKLHDKIRGKVYVVRNEFFGESVTVSGLITGGDLIAQLGVRDLGSRLLIPRNMLRSGEDVFLDGVTVVELSKKFGIPVRIVEQNGADLLRAFLGIN